MLEKYGFYMIVAGGLAAVIALVWMMVRTVRNRPTVGPIRLLLAGAVLIAVPYGLAFYERNFVPLQPYEQIVDGELRITLTGLPGFDYATLARRPEVVVLQMANSDVTDATLEHLRGLAKLRRLDVGNSQVTDAGLATIAALPALEELNVGHTKITDAGFQQHLAPKASLRRLDLTATEVKGKTKRDWKNKQPDQRDYVD
ncbi:MAG: hypothetical protein C0483_08860 [Pirellula sp.]|nr:hypothetical protein [Pirellula sp.]